MFATLLVVILNLIPVDVSTFTMAMDGNDVIRFTKQADGGWNAVELPDDDLGIFHVDGAVLTMKGEGREKTQDLSKMLGVGAATDWKKLKEIKFGSDLVQIQRKANGLDLIPKEANGEGEVKHAVAVRWKVKHPVAVHSNIDHSVEAMPPSVVSTIPQSGDTAVDPGLKEIRVTFSKDMITEQMWSVCQISDDSFPEFDGDIRYLGDKRSCVIPVKLEPGKTYVLWFNMTQFTNFHDTGNRPAIPYQLVFETRK